MTNRKLFLEYMSGLNDMEFVELTPCELCEELNTADCGGGQECYKHIFKHILLPQYIKSTDYELAHVIRYLLKDYPRELLDLMIPILIKDNLNEKSSIQDIVKWLSMEDDPDMKNDYTNTAITSEIKLPENTSTKFVRLKNGVTHCILTDHEKDIVFKGKSTLHKEDEYNRILGDNLALINALVKYYKTAYNDHKYAKKVATTMMKMIDDNLRHYQRKLRGAQKLREDILKSANYEVKTKSTDKSENKSTKIIIK